MTDDKPLPYAPNHDPRECFGECPEHWVNGGTPLEQLIDKFNINLVRRVGPGGNGWERVAYNGSGTGFGQTAREAVEDLIRQLPKE